LGIPIIDFSKNSDGYEKLKAKLNQLTNINNYIRVLVEIFETPIENEFVFRILGRYVQSQNN
jgi:hypothetical protein